MIEELEEAKRNLLRALTVDFGRINNPKFNSWYNLSWNEFYIELRKEGFNPITCPNRDWKDFFMAEKKKVEEIIKKLSNFNN